MSDAPDSAVHKCRYMDIYIYIYTDIFDTSCVCIYIYMHIYMACSSILFLEKHHFFFVLNTERESCNIDLPMTLPW